jgi:hypothetical protein
MTDNVYRLRGLVKSLNDTEQELTFQAERLDTKAAERANTRLRTLSDEYAEAAKTVRKLRTHQERRLELLLTGEVKRDEVDRY